MSSHKKRPTAAAGKDCLNGRNSWSFTWIAAFEAVRTETKDTKQVHTQIQISDLKVHPFT